MTTHEFSVDLLKEKLFRVPNNYVKFVPVELKRLNSFFPAHVFCRVTRAEIIIIGSRTCFANNCKYSGLVLLSDHHCNQIHLFDGDDDVLIKFQPHDISDQCVVVNSGRPAGILAYEF